MKRVIHLFIILSFFSSELYGQKDKKSAIQFKGSVGFYYDYYSFSQENYATFRPRYPENLFRLNAQASLQIGKYLNIPISVNITNQDVLYNLPSVPEESVLDYVRNPANQISINPKYKWAQAFLGTQTPLYSPLSTGDIPIFGVGLEVNPGKFILSATYGTSQRAIEPNISLNIPGAYEQKIMATRIGFGKLEGTKFTLNIVKIEDDLTSVNTNPIGINPIEGVTVSPYFEFKIAKKLKIRTETAGSVYTSDLLNSGTIDEDYVNAVENIITINASSTADISHNTRIDWLGEKFQIGGEVKYIGPGFLPVGYRFIERDILDYKLNTGFKLLKNKLNFTGSFGVRTNNLQNTLLSSTKRVIANVNLFAQINDKLSINTAYSNFGFNNDASILNQRIELINKSITISPTYTFKTDKYNHLIGANVSLSSFEQFDVVSNAFAKAKNATYTANYSLLFINMPLNIMVQALYLKNEIPTGDFNMLNYGINANYKFLDKKLSTSLGINFAHIDKPVQTTDVRTGLNMKLAYKMTKKLRFKLRYRYTGLKYGDSRPDAILNQNRIQFSIQQKF
jgi:hypothetical protein